MATTADRGVSEAKEKIEEAYKTILIVLSPDTFGHEEYTHRYIDYLHKVALKLLESIRLL